MDHNDLNFPVMREGIKNSICVLVFLTKSNKKVEVKNGVTYEYIMNEDKIPPNGRLYT